MRTRRFLAGLLVAGLAWGPAAPATADIGDDTNVFVFTATATVCAQTVAGKKSAPQCPPEKSQGLYMVGHPGGPNGPLGLRTDMTDTSKWTQRTGNYFLASTMCNALTLSNLKACNFDLAGHLAPVAGIGASCGISHGYGGAGSFHYGNGTWYYIYNVGWIVSAGGTLPVQGTYKRQVTGAGKSQKPDVFVHRGPLTAVVQAQGGANCVKRAFPDNKKSGASTFNMIGIGNFL